MVLRSIARNLRESKKALRRSDERGAGEVSRNAEAKDEKPLEGAEQATTAQLLLSLVELDMTPFQQRAHQGGLSHSLLKIDL